MSNNKQLDRDTEREIKWKEYTFRVEHYRYYLTLALQVNAFFYLTTGAVLGYYLQYSTPHNHLVFFLLLPILIGAVFGGIFIYGSILQKEASISIEKLRNELAGNKFALKTEEFLDVRTIHLLFRIFGCIFLLVVIALILLPCLTNSVSPRDWCIFFLLAIFILVTGSCLLPLIAYCWRNHLFDDLVRINDTERLFLRHISADDAEFFLELVKDPGWKQNAEFFLELVKDSGWKQNIDVKDLITINDVRRYISNSMVTSYKEFGFGLYLVGLKESGVSVGICGLIKHNSSDDAGIAFAFLKRFGSKGYAFESTSAVMNYALNVLGLKRVVATVLPDNQCSKKVLGEIGLRLEKVIREPGEKDIELFARDF